jgi:hypothetical protein
MLFSSSSEHMNTTYIPNVWNSGRLDLVLTTVIRVVRRVLCCSPDGFDQGNAALCSETPDEDALIWSLA